MGEKTVFQPLTRGDKISVFLYRLGILLTGGVLIGVAFFLHGLGSESDLHSLSVSLKEYEVYILLPFYIVSGITTFTIHLYMKRFRIFIKRLYVISLLFYLAAIILKFLGVGFSVIFSPLGLPLTLSLSVCIGFVAIKEAFCFRMIEGYLFGMLFPLTAVLFGVGVADLNALRVIFYLNVVLYVVFMIRKVPMPFAYDIGDKTAYEH